MRRLLVALGCMLAGCGPGMGSIGALLSKNHSDGRTIVREVPRDMESARAGLEPGDEVLFIDGKDARAMTAEEVHQSLVGSVGSTVSLTVLRAGSVLRLTVRRGPLK